MKEQKASLQWRNLAGTTFISDLVYQENCSGPDIAFFKTFQLILISI